MQLSTISAWNMLYPTIAYIADWRASGIAYQTLHLHEEDAGENKR